MRGWQLGMRYETKRMQCESGRKGNKMRLDTPPNHECPPACCGASLWLCRGSLLPLPPVAFRKVCRTWLPVNVGTTAAADSDAALRIFFLGAIALFGVSGPLPALDERGFRAGASVGIISLASSRTSTAPSCLLSLLTMSYIPKRSTSMARFG